MNAYLTQIKIAGIALLVALASFITWYATSDHYQKLAAEKQVEIDKASQAQLEINQQLLAAHAALQRKADEDHAQDQLVINDLTTRAAGVRIHIPSGCAMPQGGTSGTDPDGANRLLSARMDELFGRFQERVGKLVQRCDQLNIDARQANAVNR